MDRTQSVSLAGVLESERGEGSSSNGSASMSASSTMLNDAAEGSSSRPQAGPLPSKRGEIGYQEPEEADIAESAAGNSQADGATALPARHPADRDTPVPTPATSQPMNPTRDVEAGVSQPPPNKTILSRLKSNDIVIFAGIRLVTFLLFVLQVSLLIGTIVGWVALSTHLDAINAGNAPGSTQIFVHVAFAVGTLIEVVMLERRIFCMRAERYCHLHPGLPMHAVNGDGVAVFSLSPWNRPPLPTYAAALAQSGVGTGDVEDNMIAVQPPPAYGNTRGSTLLLAGFMSETLRAQRAEERRQNRRSSATSSTSSSRRSSRDRPMSYVSRDEEWEQRRDAMRAANVEQTLARLEQGAGRETRDGATASSRP